MVVSLDDIPKGSLVLHFITAGKPGKCQMPSHKGWRHVEKLESHHISYDPEITIKLCHLCHHKVHFWPQRLTKEDKLKMLTKRFGPKSALEILKVKLLDDKNISRLVAPSRKKFIQKQKRDLEVVENQAKRKVYKEVDLSFIKRIKAPKPIKAV